MSYKRINLLHVTVFMGQSSWNHLHGAVNPRDSLCTRDTGYTKIIRGKKSAQQEKTELKLPLHPNDLLHKHYNIRQPIYTVFLEGRET